MLKVNRKKLLYNDTTQLERANKDYKLQLI